MASSSSERRCWALVVASAILAYGIACVGSFVYDDHHSVRENEALRSLANIPAFFVDVELFSRLDNRMYRPVLLCSYALNYAIAGISPWIYKLTNVLLHAGAAALLFGLGRRLGLARAGALAGAILFAVHPLASEAVNTVSGRSELLLVCALLGALHCHCSAMLGRRGAWVGTVACAAVATGSKETAVVLPALLLALELIHRPATRAEWVAVALRLAPAAIVALGYLVLRDLLFGVATLRVPRWSGGADVETGHGRDLLTQVATMAVALPRTLGQAIFPAGLTLDPAVELVRGPWRADVFLGVLLLAALTVLGLRPARNAPRAFGTVFAWMTALPWVLIPLNVPLSEHRLYGPLVGLALVLGASWPTEGHPRRRLIAWSVGAAAVVFAAVSAERSFAFRDEKILWERAHATRPESYRACYGIGVCWMQQGDLAKAREWMQRALARYPDYVSARVNLAEIELQLGDRGDPQVAVSMARWLVLRSARPDPFHLLLLSRALAAHGTRTGEDACFDAAVEYALQCERVAAPKGLMYRTAAHARRLQGRLDDALALLDESIRRGLDHSSVRLDRTRVLRGLGRFAEAEVELQRAQAADPFDPQVVEEMRRLQLRAAPR